MIREDFKFPKFNRILTKREFDSFFKNSKYLTIGNIKVFYSRAAKDRKIAFSISSRYFNAVKRNRIKRIIREWFRLNKEAFRSLELVVSIRYSNEANEDFNLFQKKILANLGIVTNKLV